MKKEKCFLIELPYCNDLLLITLDNLLYIWTFGCDVDAWAVQATNGDVYKGDNFTIHCKYMAAEVEKK